MDNHYQTNHIMESLRRRANGDYAILRDRLTPQFDPNQEPVERHRLIPKLNELFDGGAIVAFSTDSNWDDDGGNCYNVYILKKEFVKDYCDNLFESDDGLYYLKHFVAHPDQYWHLWAGPF